MEYRLGKLIGSGAGSEVYEYGSDMVCKLYIDKYSFDSVNWEFQKTSDAYNHGLPAPQVYEIVEYNGRFGLIMERMKGKTFNEVLLEHIQLNHQRYFSEQEFLDSTYKIYVKQIKDTAHTLFKLHQRQCKLIESAKTSLSNSCKNNNYLSQNEKYAIYKLIEDLPDSDCVCHGDPNPNNLLYHNEEILVIDWTNCVTGHPLYDITEYKLMTEYADAPINLPDYLTNFYLKAKNESVKIFMDEYVRISNIDLTDLECWVVPMLVSKMSGNNSDDKQKRLLDGIKDGLRTL